MLPDQPLFNIRQVHPNSHIVTFEDVYAGWEQWFLLRGDAHHDNVHCDQEFEKEHLDLAVERRAGIIDVGDLHCAMQGKYDPRSSKEALRPEHKVDNYLDALVQTETPFYAPYAKNFIVIGIGNHETGIIGRHGVNLIDRLVYELRKVPGAVVMAGGYGGWIKFNFGGGAGPRQSLRLKYFHGGGGGAIMTSGTLDNRRQASFLPDADIIVNGHTHDMYVLPLQRERVTDMGEIVQDAVWCVRTGTYKDEYDKGQGGWHVERRGTPKPIGAVWMRIICETAPRREKPTGERRRFRIELTPHLRNG